MCIEVTKSLGGHQVIITRSWSPGHSNSEKLDIYLFSKSSSREHTKVTFCHTRICFIGDMKSAPLSTQYIFKTHDQGSKKRIIEEDSSRELMVC